MPNSEPDNDDLRYLLGELPAKSGETLSDPSLRQTSDELTSWADHEITPLTPKGRVWENIEAQVSQQKTAPVISIFTLRIWQVAALLFLALNLFWLVLSFQEGTSRRGNAIASNPSTTGSEASSDRGSTPSNTTTSSGETGAEGSRVQTLETALSQRQAQVETLQQALSAAHANAQSADADHAQMLSQLDAFFLPVDGKAQITLLAMAADRSPFTQADFDALLPPNEAAFAGDFTDGLGAAPGAALGRLADPDTILPAPSAVAVWRNDLQEGVVNFYNMPDLPNSAIYELWAQDSSTGEPIKFGDLPVDSANDFSIVVTHDQDANFSPANFTVTIRSEVTNDVPAIILWGPGNPEAEPIGDIAEP
jgi:hypothetical protein|tara:strand:+ start:2482 stop:3576 length:1095 start_codon:yes stop_codon:yes gene_type:complete